MNNRCESRDKRDKGDKQKSRKTKNSDDKIKQRGR